MMKLNERISHCDWLIIRQLKNHLFKSQCWNRVGVICNGLILWPFATLDIFTNDLAFLGIRQFAGIDRAATCIPAYHLERLKPSLSAVWMTDNLPTILSSHKITRHPNWTQNQDKGAPIWLEKKQIFDIPYLMCF